MTTSITHKKGAEILAQIGYPERDNVGNPERITDWVGGWNFGYDFNNRLISAKVPDLGVAGKPAYPVPEQPAGGDYGYDWVGNRLNPPTGVNAMVYDAADRLTLWPGMHSYTYFGDGSMKEVKNPAGTQVLRSYTYNDDGLLSGATYAGGTASFTWDADRNRVGMTMNGDDYSFVYDTTAGIPAVIEEVQPGGSVFYIREPGGELIARVDGSDIRYYHFDELGSTRMLTDGSGTVTDRYVYDAWGNTLSHTGATDQPYQYVGRLGYYTHTQDPEFALMQLGVRFYDAQVGRFTQRDALFSDSVDVLYLYAEGLPVSGADACGMFFCSKTGCTGTAPRRKCKSCWGTGCKSDPECPPRSGKPKPKPKPKPVPIKPPKNPIPPEIETPIGYIAPPGPGEGKAVCEAGPGIACIRLRREIDNISLEYGEGRISEQEYMRRKRELEKAIDACSGFYEDE